MTIPTPAAARPTRFYLSSIRHNKCPECGHAIAQYRFGVPLSGLKARIVDLIAGSGQRPSDDGIRSDALYHRLFSMREHGSREALKAHIWQINDKLAGSGWRIVNNYGHYRMVRVGKRRPHDRRF